MKKIGIVLALLVATSCVEKTYNFEYELACEQCEEHGGIVYTVKDGRYLGVMCQDGTWKDLIDDIGVNIKN